MSANIVKNMKYDLKWHIILCWREVDGIFLLWDSKKSFYNLHLRLTDFFFLYTYWFLSKINYFNIIKILYVNLNILGLTKIIWLCINKRNPFKLKFWLILARCIWMLYWINSRYLQACERIYSQKATRRLLTFRFS